MRIPENLADEIRAMAKVHNRSLNDEMLTRLMNTLGYFTERLLDQNEDAQALKVLCMEFEVFLKEKIRRWRKVTFRGMKNPVIDSGRGSGQRIILPEEVVFFSFIFRIVNCTDVGIYQFFKFHARVWSFHFNKDIRDKGSENHNLHVSRRLSL
jgi:hypothetical protein